MQIPASPHFTPISLDSAYNIQRHELPEGLPLPADLAGSFGDQTMQGILFQLGSEGRNNAILLHEEPVVVELGNATATYILFLHAVENKTTNYLDGLADFAVDGNQLGSAVAQYAFEFADGTQESFPILRRFAVQQPRTGWGASAFAAVPHLDAKVSRTATEQFTLRQMPENSFGRGETRHAAGRERAMDKLWIYALPNPRPDQPIARLILTPAEERIAVLAISSTMLVDHPLRPGLRQKLRVPVPDGVQLNNLGELDDVAIDLGHVLSARALLVYDAGRWSSQEPTVQPAPSGSEVVIEYVAHPHAKLYVGADNGESVAYDLADTSNELVPVAPAHRPVTIRVIDGETDQPVAVRLHMHGEAGEYLPPRGYHRKVNPYWFEDNYAEFVNQHNQYSYIEGECIADLPLGSVYVEITRGYEIRPIRTKVEITPDTHELTFRLDRVLDWRERGWVAADTHVHFLSPQTALLEGKAEGVHVVNLLASQWGEMFSNVGDFDGKTTLGARDFGGDGEFLVRVGTENRMQVLGHISLLGYRGPMIHPLCTGGPSESALGDPLEVTMAEWAQRCIDQGGLVVMPHAPNPQLERAADFVLGVVHAVEMMTFNPLNPNNMQISPYGIADWYRYLNLGYQLPVVGGSDKMAASSLLGGSRTYAHLGNHEFTYENWMRAVQAGNTFVTVGPLLEMDVDGQVPGSVIELPAGGGAVNVSWRAESVNLPIESVEIVVGSHTAEQCKVGGELSSTGSRSISVRDSTWIALRVRGSYHSKAGDIAAHSSAVQIRVGGAELFAETDAMRVLQQIEGAMAYVDTLAPRPEAQRFKQLRATLETAHNRLHQRMHRAGIYHHHTPLHDHASTREH